MMRRIAWVVAAIFAAAALGCAPGNLVTVKPGLVDVAPSSAAKEPAERWTFWVRSVVDERGEGLSGATDIGAFDKRFADESTRVVLDQPPGDYLKAQLSRFLLNRGMEASAQEKAAVFLDLKLSKFAISRDSSTMLDKVVFEMDYLVQFTSPAGENLGQVRLPDGRWFKGVSLFGSQAKIESLVREMLGDSFKRLAESDVYAAAAKR